ncbi:MAG: hypothetical protein RJQ09_09950 [Cyclobacteriaceae bacterium]
MPNIEKLRKLDVTKKSKRFETEFEEVLAELKLYIIERADLSFEFEALESGLTHFLKQNDQAILFAADHDSFLPKTRSSKKLDHLIAEFISHVYKKDYKVFSFIINITVGYAITGTILYSEFNSFQGKLKGVNVYFDTTFIFDLLGIDGEFKQKLATELVKILNRQGVNLFLLQTNQGEVEANLSECLKLMDDGKTDPSRVSNLTFKQCFQNSITNSDLHEIVVNFEERLRSFLIKAEIVPDFVENKNFQIDEDKLYDVIVDVYSARKAKVISTNSKEEEENKKKLEKSEKRNNTILRDVKVLSGMYRFRAGRKPSTIKDCNAIFVTTNSSLAYASRRYEVNEYKVNHTLPVAITDVFLGTLIWLQSPAEIQNLREKKLLMDCLSVMQPGEKLIKKYVEQIDLLKAKGAISNEMVYLLRAHRSAYNILESKTLGDPDELNEQSTQEIIDELIAQIKKEEVGKYEETNSKMLQMKSERDEAKREIKRLKHSKATQLLKTLKDLKSQIDGTTERIKTLEQMAKIKVHQVIRSIFILWLSSTVILVILTILFGWDTMEPIVYFVGAITTIGSYSYLFLRGKHLSLSDIVKQMVEEKKMKYLNENGIKLNDLNELIKNKKNLILEVKAFRNSTAKSNLSDESTP